MKDFILLLIAENGFRVWRFIRSIFHNFGLKFVLWLPYMIALVYYAIGTLTIKIRYDIPYREFIYVLIFIIGYQILMDLAQHIHKKYWGLTKE